MSGEQILTVSASGATSVEISATKIDYTLDKPLIEIPLPRSKSNMDSGTLSDSYLIDIGKVKGLIQIQGMLIDDSTSSGRTKRDNLHTIVKKYRTVTLTWGTTHPTSVTGNIQKTLITETPGKYSGEGDTSPEETKFDVQLSLIIGTDK